jgi:cephalosporin hydroxylase
VADQGNEVQLKELEKLGPFDLIVDDGSHIYNHQILTFNVLFPFLKKGHIYVVEDVCTSYWPNFGGNPTCIEYFKNLIDAVNFYGKSGSTPREIQDGSWTRTAVYYRREDYQDDLPEFESIHFMNSLIVVHKRN